VAVLLDALDRLDGRYTPRLRRHPEPLLVILAVVFVAAAATHVARFDVGPEPVAPGGDEPFVTGPAPEDPSVQLPDGALRVGPARGDVLDQYTVVRARQLGELAETDPTVRGTAIISFDRYLTPDGVEEILLDRELELLAVRWQLRADGDAPARPSPAPRGRMVVSTGLATALEPVWAAEADGLRREAADLEEMAGTTQDDEFGEVFARDAQELRSAAEVSAGGCACVYAAEVRGALAELAVLLGDDAVRLVDVVPAGRDGEVVLLALLPEERDRAGDSRDRGE
jgi:hypothetical protein